MAISGDDLQRMLEGTMNAEFSCRSCQETFTFEAGGSRAMDSGITDKVVMCPKCGAVYEVSLTPREAKLLDDVTSRYGGRARTSSKQGAQEKRRWQFWK